MKNNKKKIFIEALEQRIMLDGAGASTALDVIDERSRDKLLSVVIYIAPENNEGTWLYENQSGKNPKQIEWIPNRAFVFSRNDHTWHSYKADGKQNRLTLVYNLRSKKLSKKNV